MHIDGARLRVLPSPIGYVALRSERTLTRSVYFGIGFVTHRFLSGKANVDHSKEHLDHRGLGLDRVHAVCGAAHVRRCIGPTLALR
jgi:hypothetical protein